MGGQGEEYSPDTFHQEIFADLPGKEGQGRKGKWRGKEGKFEREEVENWKWKGKRYESENFFTFYFFYFIFIYLFIFFCHFWNHWNLFGVYQNGRFLLGKSIFYTGKNQEKWLCPPLKNIPLYTSVSQKKLVYVHFVLNHFVLCHFVL